MSGGVDKHAGLNFNPDDPMLIIEEENPLRIRLETGTGTVYSLVQEYLLSHFDGDPDVNNITSAFVRAIFVPSIQYQRGKTVRKWQEAQRSISPTRGKVTQGDEIVREGARVTKEVRQKLISFERARLGGAAPRLQWKRTIGQILLSLATFTIFFLYLFMVRRTIFDDNPKILLMALLFAGIIGLFAIAVRMDAGVMYAVPVVIVSVLLTMSQNALPGAICRVSESAFAPENSTAS